MWIDWSVTDNTLAASAQTLTMDFTFNLFNAAICGYSSIQGTSTVFALSSNYQFVPYITILNTSESTAPDIVTVPFDAIAMVI